ncbi:MAG: CopD family protein [Acidobacteriota bacterium]|nr:CopD family protein [Acidobacteriota bacterium]
MLKLVDIFGYLSVILRAGTLVGQSLVLGGLFFLLWIARSSPELPVTAIEKVQSSTRRMLRFAAIGLAVVQVFYLYVNSAVLMVTAEIGFNGVVGASFFIAGSIIFVAAVFVAAFAPRQTKSAPYALVTLTALLLAASVMTNHAAARIDGRVPLIVLTTLHELATGFWIGGLPFLLLGLVVSRDRPTQWYITQRFSRLALISVALLVISGFAMSLSYIGSPPAIYGTAYGVMVSAKVLMLGALLAIGGVNFLLLRKYKADEVMPRLRRLVEAEVGIGITIVLTAASLTSQPPAVDQPNDIVTAHQVAERMKPAWPRLGITVLAKSSTNSPESFVATQDPTKAAPVSIDGVPLSSNQLANIGESEINHHWMGVIVLAMGLLALLAKTGKAKWAEYWPLLLIGIAVFVIVRADTEAWPLGPQSFWATCLRPEDFQHRLAALVCVGFAVFELRVRRRKLDNQPGALVFPLMCALGGAVLLTHSHGLANVKEELLAELSHVPMGILAVFAGWSRWLELRLPSKDRTIPAWTWPVCFVLIGSVLLNYREM